MPALRRDTTLPSSFHFIRSYDGTEEYELKKNGLHVLYRHDPRVPVVGVMVTYLVGSRHEKTGVTGSTHILEHLMFRGSKKYPPKRGTSILDILSKKGAIVNASTFLDRTNYYAVIPEKYFDFVVELEADRMRNAILTKHDLESELPAVQSEYALFESDSVSFLDERMWATALIAHPYRHSTLGWKSDIEHASIEKLIDFYNTYYHPNNAYVTVIGSIQRNTALRTIGKYFGVHKRSSQTFPQPHTVEPEQQGKRHITVERSGTKNIVCIAYKVPEGLHADTPSVLVLSALLGGTQTSRLRRNLVDAKLASSAWTAYTPFHDPSLLLVWATNGNGRTHENVDTAMRRTMREIALKGVLPVELERVKARLLTDIAKTRDGCHPMLSALNEAIALGDWRFFFALPDALANVTTRDIQTVAKKYLVEKNMTTGYYYATGL